MRVGDGVENEMTMGDDRKGRVSYVIGPDGSPLTLADLPPPGTKRWVIRRKAEVVAAVRGGLLSLDDAEVRAGQKIPFATRNSLVVFFQR